MVGIAKRRLDIGQSYQETVCIKRGLMRDFVGKEFANRVVFDACRAFLSCKISEKIWSVV